MTAMLTQQAKQSISGRDSLHQLALSTDRGLLTDLFGQLLLAAAFGWIHGSLLEGSGWLIDGEGQPLTGALAVGFAWIYPLTWGFVIAQLMGFWRERMQFFLIPLLRNSFLLYAVLEHQPHELLLLPLCSTPPVLTLKNRNPIRLFAARINSLVWVLPLSCRVLGYSDYPTGWGRSLNAVFIGGLVAAAGALVVPDRLLAVILMIPAFVLLGGWLAFQQARLRATAWCLAAVFLPPKGD